jgi:hypothetical protein
LTHPADEWSVLTKSVGPAGSAAPSEDQRQRLLGRLPGGDKWLQYPPASGRGHAFETRFWVTAPDAAEAAGIGVDLVVQAQSSVGLGAWRVVRLHAASRAERAIEHYPGLEERSASAVDWSVMHRSLVPEDEPPLDGAERDRLIAALDSTHKVVAGAGRLVELRFWVAGDDAVHAAGRAEAAVASAMGAIGRTRWTTVRIQTAAVVERRRELYLGVERRLNASAGG